MTVARCAEGMTWCKYACLTGRKIANTNVPKRNSGTASQNESTSPTPTVEALSSTDAAIYRVVRERKRFIKRFTSQLPKIPVSDTSAATTPDTQIAFGWPSRSRK